LSEIVHNGEWGLELQILQLAVDSGFATIEVYQWARRQGGRVLVIKGDSRTPSLSLGRRLRWRSGPAGAKLKRGVRVWPVNSGMAKEELYRWLRLDRPTDEDLAKGTPFPVRDIVTSRATAKSTSSRSPPNSW
jgi:phage terminase large subunit GpA-like protein